MDAIPNVCPICARFQATNADVLQRHASVCGDKSHLRQLSRFTPAPIVPATPPGSIICFQANAPPGDLVLAKSHSCYAVLGHVCWFCRQSATSRAVPTLKRSLLETAYGGLPLLYHPACIDGLADQTDSSLLAAYRVQAADRSATSMCVSSVGLSAMRSSSSAWLHQKSSQHGKQHADEEGPDSNSEDDATPLLHLAKKSCLSGQPAARRTPFQLQTVDTNASSALEGTRWVTGLTSHLTFC